MRLNRTWLVFLIAGALFATTTLINGARKFQSDVEVGGNLVIDGTCTGCIGSGASISGSPSAGNLAKWSSSTALTDFTLGGDCTFSTPNITCTKTSNVAFSPTATANPIICSSYVATNEATSSTSYTNLMTSDTCTFTLAATTTLVLMYSADTVSNTSTHNSFNIVNVDTADTSGETLCTMTTGFWASCGVGYKASFASGSHTVLVKHKVDGNSSNWQNRLMVISATN